MEREEEQPKNVKTRYVNVLKSVNHHRKNVVMPHRVVWKQGEAGIGGAESEMSEVVNDEREHDESAHDHVARGPARFYIIPIAIFLRPRAAIFDRELDREINVGRTY